MSFSPGYTTDEIRAYVFEYQGQPYGTKKIWLEQQSLTWSLMRRWTTAVFEGELDRGLVPRESSGMASIPRQRRELVERSLSAQQKAHDAERDELNERIRSLEASNTALGKAIGLLHAMSEEEPGANRLRTDPSSSLQPRNDSSPS